MALLIESDETVIQSNKTISEILSPISVHRFSILEKAQVLAESKPSKEEAKKLYDYIPDDLQKKVLGKNLQPTVAVNFHSGLDDSVKERIAKSQKIHINPADEWHFIFAGCLILYFRIKGTVHILVTQAGDSVYLPGGIEHWIKLSQDYYLTLVSFHAESLEEFHKKVIYKDEPLPKTII